MTSFSSSPCFTVVERSSNRTNAILFPLLLPASSSDSFFIDTVIPWKSVVIRRSDTRHRKATLLFQLVLLPPPTTRVIHRGTLGVNIYPFFHYKNEKQVLEKSLKVVLQREETFLNNQREKEKAKKIKCEEFPLSFAALSFPS